LFAQLESFQPTGDADIDTEWRAALQRRFATLATDRRALTERLNQLTKDPERARPRGQQGNPSDLLARVPCSTRDLTLLPEADPRQLYDALHLQVRYDHNRKRLALRVTIDPDTVGRLANRITNVMGTDAAAGRFPCGRYPRRGTQNKSNIATRA
jgi:hypothetical protein